MQVINMDTTERDGKEIIRECAGSQEAYTLVSKEGNCILMPMEFWKFVDELFKLSFGDQVFRQGSKPEE